MATESMQRIVMEILNYTVHASSSNTRYPIIGMISI